MNKIRCISVDVFRSSSHGDCSFHGISGRFNRLLVACEDGPDSFDADVAVPINFCMVEARRLYSVFGTNQGEVVYDVIPAMVNEDGKIVKRGGRWYMMGGSFAYTSDSRFSNLHPGTYGAIAIHDRWEGRKVG